MAKKTTAKIDEPQVLGVNIEETPEGEQFTIIANDGLPSGPTKQTVDPQSLRILMIAPPGFGKTTFFSAFPDCLLLAFEEGHKFVECPKIIIDKWEGDCEGVDADGNMHLSALAAFDRIQKSDRFKFIIIDTVDAMAKMCADHYLDLYHAQGLGDLGDFGVGYNIGQNDPTRKAFNSILKSGRGLGYTTHQVIIEEKDKKGKVLSVKKTSSMPNGIMKFLFPQVDTILHGEFGEVQEGETRRDRIIRTEGSEEILAKNRGGIFPPAWIVPKDAQDAWQQFECFMTSPATVQEAYNNFTSVYEG